MSRGQVWYWLMFWNWQELKSLITLSCPHNLKLKKDQYENWKMGIAHQNRVEGFWIRAEHQLEGWFLDMFFAWVLVF